MANMPRDVAGILRAVGGLEHITAAEREALRDYTTTWGQFIQHYLWNAPEVEQYGAVERRFAERCVQLIDSAFGRIEPLRGEIVVFRGQGEPKPPVEAGLEIVWAGYLSTTLERSVAEADPGDDFWLVTIGPGCPVLYLNAIGASITVAEEEVGAKRHAAYH